MIDDWLGTTWTEFWLVMVSSVAIIAGVIAAVRVNGLRSFSKMSSFDFAVTVAIGSLIASVAVTSTSLLNGLIGIAAIFATQRFVARARRIGRFERVTDNTPLLLMEGDRLLEENLVRARVTAADVQAKLREANVLHRAEIRAVVLETTGDISVLHGPTLDRWLLEGVIGASRFDAPT